MLEFLKDHSWPSAAIALVIFLVWTLPLWLGTVWPMVTKKTLPEWLAERQMPRMTAILRLVGTGVLTIAVISVFIITRVDSGRYDADQKLERIIRHTFTNTTVELDGKSFEDCRFENVTLMFHGTAPFALINVTLAGSIKTATDNKAIRNFERARDYLHALAPKSAERWSGEQDEMGNVFRYPSPNPTTR